MLVLLRVSYLSYRKTQVSKNILLLMKRKKMNVKLFLINFKLPIQSTHFKTSIIKNISFQDNLSKMSKKIYIKILIKKSNKKKMRKSKTRLIFLKSKKETRKIYKRNVLRKTQKIFPKKIKRKSRVKLLFLKLLLFNKIIKNQKKQ